MFEYLQKILKEIDMPSSSSGHILLTFEKYDLNELENVISFYIDQTSNYENILQKFNELSDKYKVDHFEGYAVLMCLLTKKLRELYEKLGYSEEMFLNIAKDIKYKVEECELVYSITGIFVPEWYKDIFQIKTFAFGRLQFQLCPFGLNYENIKSHDKSVNIHIPRSGEPLLPSLVDASINKASLFFKKEFNNGPILYRCNSWLLFPENKNILNQNSNIIKFANRFKIINTTYFANYEESWRLFDCKFVDVSFLPSDSTLRRGYINLVKNKQKTGSSFGFFYR